MKFIRQFRELIEIAMVRIEIEVIRWKYRRENRRRVEAYKRGLT